MKKYFHLGLVIVGTVLGVGVFVGGAVCFILWLLSIARKL